MTSLTSANEGKVTFLGDEFEHNHILGYVRGNDAVFVGLTEDYEVNPVAYQVARLRVDCAIKNRKSPSVTVTLRNIYRDGIEERAPGASVFLGEMHPHVIKGTGLEVTQDEGYNARYGWGKKLQNLDVAIARYLNAIETAIRQNGNTARLFSLRVPAEWAEDMERAEDRKRFFDVAGTLFVDGSGVSEQLVDRRMSRGDIVVLADGIDSELQSPPNHTDFP